MSAVTAARTVRESVDDLIARVERGEILPAFEDYYAENIAMQENNAAPTVGKDANRAREEAFVASVAEVHENRAVSRLVDGDRAMIVWAFEFTGKDGNRYRLDQVAHQEWENGRIVRERFVYDSAAVLVAPRN
jgi:ketosteroid isomerase-like protein